MAKGLHGDGPQPDNPETGVISVLLVIALVVLLLWLPGLRDLFNAMADPFSAR